MQIEISPIPQLVPRLTLEQQASSRRCPDSSSRSSAVRVASATAVRRRSSHLKSVTLRPRATCMSALDPKPPQAERHLSTRSGH